MHASDTGFLQRHCGAEIAARLAATNRDFARVLVVDTLPDAIAGEITPALAGSSLETLSPEQLELDDLHLAVGQLDLIVAGPGIQRRNDLPGTLIQFRRALVADGLLMAAIPAEGTLEELRQCLLAAEDELAGGAAMRIDPFIEIRQAGALLQRAGFALPVADLEPLTLRYADTAALLADLRAHGATNGMQSRLQALPKNCVATLEKLYRNRFSGADGRIDVSVNIVYLTGWVPHESQQKALKPGSAEARLSDFLPPR